MERSIFMLLKIALVYWLVITIIIIPYALNKRKESIPLRCIPSGKINQ